MWGKRGVRGSELERLIEFTNERYSEMGLCRVDKVATPVKVVEMTNGVITRGFYEKKSTVDFVGIIQGVFVAFDAKETEGASLPIRNIHEHQVKYMVDVQAQGGLAFFIVYFKAKNEFYLMSLEVLRTYYDDDRRKSIPYAAMQSCIPIEEGDDHTLRYLDALNRLLDAQEED